MLKKLLFISFVIFITFQTIETKAAPGDHDPSFGSGGIIEHQFAGLKGISEKLFENSSLKNF